MWPFIWLESGRSSLGFDADSVVNVLATRSRSEAAPIRRIFYGSEGDVRRRTEKDEPCQR